MAMSTEYEFVVWRNKQLTSLNHFIKKMPTLNFIKSVLFSGSGEVKSSQRKIIFSLPNDIKENTITVLCGRNRTGKSYILRRIGRCISKHNKNIDNDYQNFGFGIQEDDVIVEISNPDKRIEKSFLIDDISILLKSPNTISISKNTTFKKRGHPNHRPSEKYIDDNNEILFKICLDNFASESIEYICKCIDKPFDTKEWDEDKNDYRKGLWFLFEENVLYKLNEENDLIKFFHAATGGYLYLSSNRTNQGCTFDIYLVYSENIVLSYSRWSDGQKVLFICLIVIKYFNPAIFLFDEIENHLHPEFISILLEYLKKNVSQSIITTHHPHIIFSNYVDSVWYIELENLQDDLPKKIERIAPKNIKAPRRKVAELEKNYEKLISTYKLFDNYDNRLMLLSSSALSNLNEHIVEIFTKLFYYEIASSKPEKKSDLQVNGLLKHLFKRITQDRELRVLEIGAGNGRILLDISKLKSEHLARDIVWDLYEPSESVRHVLEKNISVLHSKYNINILSEFHKSIKYDLIIMANVIHELHPINFAKNLNEIQQVIKNDGEMIVIELYPLLLPEKLSVPYKSEELLSLFRNLSWKGYSDKVNFKYSSIEAYWLSLSPNWKNNALNFSDILSIIHNYWLNEQLKNRCQDYNGRIRLKEVEDMITIMCELTSIASILCYKLDEWNPL